MVFTGDHMNIPEKINELESTVSHPKPMHCCAFMHGNEPQICKITANVFSPNTSVYAV